MQAGRPAAACCLDFAGLVEDHAEELAILETLDAGKPLTEALYIDAAYTAETIRYYAGWATKLHGDVLPVSPAVGEAFVYTRREPLGVVGAIVPWNFPMLITSWKIGPALAAGQHRGPQAVGDDVADGDPPGRAGPRSRAAARHAERGHRLRARRPARRWPSTPGWPSWPSPARPPPGGGS